MIDASIGAIMVCCEFAEKRAKGVDTVGKEQIMQSISSTDFYTIAVDTQKNRLYITIKGGMWTDPQKLRNWLGDLAAGLKLLSPRFTELIDWTQMIGTSLTDFFIDSQKLTIKAGLRKAARLYSRESFAKVQMDNISAKTGFPVQSFFDRKAAEAWLDEK
jgi:hypothetical protein